MSHQPDRGGRAIISGSQSARFGVILFRFHDTVLVRCFRVDSESREESRNSQFQIAILALFSSSFLRFDCAPESCTLTATILACKFLTHPENIIVPIVAYHLNLPNLDFALNSGKLLIR